MAIRQKVAKILSSDITKNSAKLLSANLLVQIIGLLVYPILTRLYSPENFGLFNLFISISGFLVLLATAEFQNAILLPKEQEKAVACFHTGFFIAIFVCVVLVCSIPFSEQIANFFNAPILAHWYWAVPVFVFISSFWTLINYWYTREKLFNQIRNYQITQCLTNATAKCGFGFVKLTGGGLIYSALISPIIALTVSIILTFKNHLKPLLSFNKKNCLSVLHEYSNFPKFSLPRALLNFFSGNILIYILTPFYGLKEIGILGMAITLAFRPIELLSNSLYQVLFQKTSEKVTNRESIRKYYRKFLLITSSVVIPCFTIVCLFLPDVTEFLLGQEWRKTGECIFWMFPWLFAVILTSPISYLPDIFQKQKIGLLFEIALIAARIVAIFLGIFLDEGFFLIIFLYSFASAIVIGLQLNWYCKLINNYEQEILQ